MVRFCIVPNCDSNDNDVLSHRFPRKDELKQKWASSLGILNFTNKELNKYVVCTKHFDIKDYRSVESNFLNWTAIPKLSNVNSRFHATTTTNPSFVREKRKECILNNDDEYVMSSRKNKLNEFEQENNETEVELNNYDNSNDTDDYYFEIGDDETITINEYKYEFENIDECTTNSIETIIDSNENMQTENLNFIDDDELKSDSLKIQERDENDSNIVEYREIGCQTDVIDDDDEIADAEFSHLTKSQLIELLKESNSKIVELKDKVMKIENARSKLVESLKILQSML